MKISDLSKNPDNPRTITEAKQRMLLKALRRFGDLSGIVYNRKTQQLVGGHQRRDIFDPATPITIVKKYSKPTKTGTIAEGFIEAKGERFAYREVFWDEHTERAANIAANKGAGEWDPAKLGEWIKDLSGFDVDFDLDLTMFDADEIKDITGITVKEHTRVSATGVDEDDVPEIVEPKTKLGDAYVLGSHRLLCGDATDSKAVERLVNGKTIDMVFTDPPYGISIVAGKSVGGSKGFGSAGGGKIIKANSYAPVIGDDSTDTAVKAYEISKSIAKVLIFWGANYYASALPDSSCWLVWDKENTGNFADAELAWTNQKTAVRIFKHMWNGMIKASEHGQKRVHPTQKPIALAEWAFENYGGPANVLDLFGGSGSTLIACEKTHRRCFMMEIDPHYCDVIVARWEKYTGLKAKLIRTETKTKRASQAKEHANGESESKASAQA